MGRIRICKCGLGSTNPAWLESILFPKLDPRRNSKRDSQSTSRGSLGWIGLTLRLAQTRLTRKQASGGIKPDYPTSKRDWGVFRFPRVNSLVVSTSSDFRGVCLEVRIRLQPCHVLHAHDSTGSMCFVVAG